MGYAMPNVVKELHLPISSQDDLTIEEYEKKYGIDFKKFISIDGNYLKVIFGLNKVFLIDLMNNQIFPFINESSTGYTSGVSDAEYFLYGNPAGTGAFAIKIYVDKNTGMSLENVKISYVEI